MVKSGLIVSYYFPPSGGGGVQRWSKFIKYLSEWNWQFTVITASSGHLFSDNSLIDEIPSNVRVIRTGKQDLTKKVLLKQKESNYFLRWLASFYYKYDSRSAWNSDAWEAIKTEMENKQYDAVFCTIPPYLISALAVKIQQKFQDIPVILDMRDAWSINPLKIHPTVFHRYADRKKELNTMCDIDNFVMVAQFIYDDYNKNVKGFKQKNSVVIPNGYDERDFKDINDIQTLESDCFNIAYSGTFYSHLNNPDRFFYALKILRDEGIYDIRFHHIGKSAYDINKLSKKHQVDHIVTSWGYRPHKECLALLNAMDAFIILFDERYRNAEFTIGSKLYEYMRLKKPVLGMIPAHGEAASTIRNTESGLICSSYNSHEIAECLKKIRSEKERFNFKGIEKFERRNLALQLKEFVENKVLKNN